MKNKGAGMQIVPVYREGDGEEEDVFCLKCYSVLDKVLPSVSPRMKMRLATVCPKPECWGHHCSDGLAFVNPCVFNGYFAGDRAAFDRMIAMSRHVTEDRR